MDYAVTAQQMKAVDQNTIKNIGIPSMVLMERAALAVAEAAEHMAKYVWLDSPDFDFILSDNCLDIVPGRPAVLILKKSDISRAVQADELKHLDTLCAYDIR